MFFISSVGFVIHTSRVKTNKWDKMRKEKSIRKWVYKSFYYNTFPSNLSNIIPVWTYKSKQALCLENPGLPSSSAIEDLWANSSWFFCHHLNWSNTTVVTGPEPMCPLLQKAKTQRVQFGIRKIYWSRRNQSEKMGVPILKSISRKHRIQATFMSKINTYT